MNDVRFWQIVSLVLGLCLIGLVLWTRLQDTLMLGFLRNDLIAAVNNQARELAQMQQRMKVLEDRRVPAEAKP